MCKKKQRSGEYGVADADEPDSALQHVLRSDVGSARSYKRPRSGPRVLQNQVGALCFRALCVIETVLGEFLDCGDICHYQTVAKPLRGCQPVHFARCSSQLSALQAWAVTSRVDIARVRTVSFPPRYGIGGYRLGALLVERYARHATVVTRNFFEGSCSVPILFDALSRLARFRNWTTVRDEDLGIRDSTVTSLLHPWFASDPATWPESIVAPVLIIATRHGRLRTNLRASPLSGFLNRGATTIIEALAATYGANRNINGALLGLLYLVHEETDLNTITLQRQLLQSRGRAWGYTCRSRRAADPAYTGGDTPTSSDRSPSPFCYWPDTGLTAFGGTGLSFRPRRMTISYPAHGRSGSGR